jgi:NADPH-dependent glutamate synthase beta subunit-like oxidoreductase/NAD(P)H-flavin reductase
MNTNEPQIGFAGFSYRDLHDPTRLPALTARFDAWARERMTPEAWAQFERYRATRGEGLSPEEISEALVATAPHLGTFLAQLFGIEHDDARLKELARREAVIFAFKRDFVKKRVAKRKKADIEALDRRTREALDRTARDLLAAATGQTLDVWNDEREVAEATMALLAREDLFRKSVAAGGVAAGDADRESAATLARSFLAHPSLRMLAEPLGVREDTRELSDEHAAKLYTAALEVLDRWCALRMHDKHYDHHWVSLRLPRPLDFQHLVHLKRPDERTPELFVSPDGTLRARDGFGLTDPRPSQREIFDNTDYCIYCHDRNKDSCSKGFRDKTTGAFKPNPLGIPLTGCPLEEKISEMNFLKNSGQSLAALAVAMIDNPMLPGTGHRICNDCMKACIYQKQQPVNIPAIETSVLTDVLDMRWGFEVYDLLTRWNPLRVVRPEARPYIGKNVLVVGLGPAGYTLANWLLNEGFGVVGIDGLKIEPMARDVLEKPVERWRDLYENLDERTLLGFGGVSEYGITVRWDKNFLGVVYMTLARRKTFRVYGGVRFGGTLDLDDAWKLGFDHVAIAAGAGKPTLVDMPNGLARGIRQASDFLMALQLSGAYKRSSLANLNVRLPGLVIGGGLTGIDTATEMRAYYVVHVEKVLERYEILCAELGEAAVLKQFDPEEREVLDEALAHGRAIRAEREAAAREGRKPDFNALIDSWGGVTLAYRRSLNDSPAYRLNHEEVEKFLEEGVRFLERASPKEALVDAYGAVRAVVFDRMEVRDGKLVATGETIEVPARTVCIAAGTSPNVTYEKEMPGTFEMDPKTRAFRSHRAVVAEDGSVSLVPDPEGFFTSYNKGGRVVSYYGDNHPVYAGSVVKAMASAKDGYPYVAALFARHVAQLDPAQQPARDAAWAKLVQTLDHELLASVVAVNRLTPTIVEVVVKAPAAARKFNPGQFYRLQNFETNALVIDGTRLTMEGLALTGASTDPEAGLLSMIVLEMGASSRLCAALRPGEPVVVMGPTGTPTEIPKNENVLLAGGGLGNAVLFSIGKALRANGCKVIYFAGYKKPEDIYKMDEIEASADQIVWAVDAGIPPVPRRPQDRAMQGNIVQAMVAYASGELGERLVDLATCERVIAIGSDRMMAAVKRARHGVLKPYLKPGHVAIGSINSPMQCMMKEICAQCLQRHEDPVTRKVTIVFSCFNQDQDLDKVDFEFLNTRLRQASLQEKLANQWLDRLMRKQNVMLV